jgi:amidase
MNEILSLNAHALSDKIAAGYVSASDVVQATLKQIAAENPNVNAIVSLRDEDALLAEAAAADSAPRKGWLHGIPVAVKDLANVAGLPTSMGSPALKGRIAAKSDLVVQRMQDAGAIVIGKTNTPEFGLGSHTYNPVFGATENAYVAGRSAGGSSGGAAVALAKNMVCVADGSDMMGSLRNPAGWNNVYGLRPSWGRVPSEAEGDTFLHQLATSGPMARCPRDLAHLLEVQAGPDPYQPHGLPVETYHDKLDADLKLRKIAWLGDWGGAFPMEAGVEAHCAAQVARFADLGCKVDAINAPFDVVALWESWITLRSWSVNSGLGIMYDDPKLRDHLKPEAIWEIENGRKSTVDDIQRASVIKSNWFKAAAELFDSYDALVLPTAQCWPFPVEWDWPKEIAGVQMDTYHRWMEVVVPASLIGLPALAVPAGFNDAGMPMGLQLIGRRNNDLGMLQLAQGWHEMTHA